MSQLGPKTCPGLSITGAGVFWKDSLGREHDLMKERRMSPGEAAIELKRSTEWVLRKIRNEEFYPCVYFNVRLVEVWACGIEDYLVRAMLRDNPKQDDVAA